MKELSKETQIAYLTAKYVLLLQKQRNRKISLEATHNVRLMQIIVEADEENKYSVLKLRQMKKSQLVQLIINMEETKKVIEDYATQLKSFNVSVSYIEQIESFGV